MPMIEEVGNASFGKAAFPAEQWDSRLKSV
jgi:hypothetical protein